MLMVLFAVTFICLISSTREGRAEWRIKLRPYGRMAWIATAVIWGVVIGGEFLLP